jgi:hypothetical protein
MPDFMFGLWYLGVLHIWNKLQHCGKHVITLENVVYYVTTMLMVLGVKNDVQIGEFTFKVVHQRCVCSVNMFINMQYIQWGQFRNFLFLMVIIHLLKNSVFICKLNVCANKINICILILYFLHVEVQLSVYDDCDSVSYTCGTHVLCS